MDTPGCTSRIRRSVEGNSGGFFADEYGPSMARGATVDKYVVGDRLGQGGFGVVYHAEQKLPIKREVALKIIKRGMDTDAVVARFSAERQALAMMEHPGVAKVFDSGSTSDGRPYFAMELVRGESITSYSDTHLLTVEDRLGLFVKVCDAVQHAHAKGVIHRDLKPGNIMVSGEPSDPVVKVIDFGVAKALHDKLTEETLHTHAGQIIGTPEFMSPEQATMIPGAVDTRSDVYSLGVVLYVLLTGSLPFERSRFSGATLAEIQGIIRESSPTKPSTKVSSIGDAAGTPRRVDWSTLVRKLRRDLDWIVIKCLEKDPERRYDGVSELKHDIERYLRHEPVLASPPRTIYKLEKFYRRNRVGVTAAGVVLVALVGGLAGTTYGLMEADAQRSIAAERADAAESALERAELAERDASDRAEQLELIAAFQADQLGAVSPDEMGGVLRASIDSGAGLADRESLASSLSSVNFTDVAMEALRVSFFERTFEAIDDRFAGDPQIRSRLLHSLAMTARSLGLIEVAREPQLRALELSTASYGVEHAETLKAQMGQAIQLRYDGALDASLAMHREVLERRASLFGVDHVSTYTAHNNLGVVLQAMGKYDEARVQYEIAIAGRTEALGAEHDDTLGSLANMGGLERVVGNNDRSREILAGLVDSRVSMHGSSHPKVYNSKAALGMTLRESGDYEGSVELLREVVAGRTELLGLEHPKTLSSINALGQTLQEMGRAQEAEELLFNAHYGRTRILGTDHPHTVDSLNNLANAIKDQGRFEEAEVLYLDAVDLSRRVLGEDHPATLTSINNLGSVYKELNRLEEAERYYLEAYEGRLRVFGRGHPNTVASVNNMGSILQTQGRLEEAKPYFIAAAEGFREIHGLEHPDTLTAMNNIGQLLKQLGDYEEAEPYYMEAIAAAREVFGPTHYRTAVIINNVGTFYRDLERWDEAEAMGREAVDLGIQGIGSEHWLIGVFKWHLARTLAGRREMAEAELLGLEAYETILAALGREHPRTQVVWRFMPQLYDLWHTIEPEGGYDVKAAAWRATAEPAEAVDGGE